MIDKYILQTPSLFKVDDSFNDPRFMRVKIAVMHSGENLNKSFLSTKTIKNAKNTFKNVPILANVITKIDEKGNEYLDYGSHDMHKEADQFNKGKTRTIYDEKVVGIIPEQNDFEIVHDNERDVDFAVVTGLIYRLYGNYVADILEERGGETSVSCEVNFDKTSVDAKTKLVIVEEFTMLGLTLLGENVVPAMKGANATMFSLAEDSRHEQMINVMKELTEALNKYTATFADNSKRKEEKDKLNTELFKELCEKYSVSESDITFEYSELDDETLKKTFAEHFDDGDGESTDGDGGTTNGDGESSNGDSNSGESTDNNGENSEGNAQEGSSTENSGTSENSETGDSETQTDSGNTSETSETPVTSDTENGSNGDEEDQDELETNNSYPSKSKIYQVSYTLTNGEDTKEFSLSMKEEIAALTDLFNTTYCDEDNDWYSVDAFADTKTIIAHGWYKHFKQKYTVKDGVYSLKGDRVEVFAQYLTQEEIDALEGLKGKFAEVSDKLALYETEPDKIAVLSSEDYSLIKDTEAYKELSKRENYFSLSTEELTSRLESMLNAYAKELGKKTFSVEKTDTEEKNEESKKDFFAFARVETKSSFLDGLLGKK